MFLDKIKSHSYPLQHLNLRLTLNYLISQAFPLHRTYSRIKRHSLNLSNITFLTALSPSYHSYPYSINFSSWNFGAASASKQDSQQSLLLPVNQNYYLLAGGPIRSLSISTTRCCNLQLRFYNTLRFLLLSCKYATTWRTVKYLTNIHSINNRLHLDRGRVIFALSTDKP